MIKQSVDQNILHISIERFGDLDIYQTFFDSFRCGYAPYYSEWVELKKNDKVYTVKESDELVGFMKLKPEYEDEDYSDIHPVLSPSRRLKISSLKVTAHNRNIGSWFMSVALLEAKEMNASEIYATLLSDCEYKESLVKYLTKWGFQFHGKKNSHRIVEDVYKKVLI